MVRTSNKNVAIECRRYGKNKLRSGTHKKLYLFFRRVDCPLRNVRSVCSPSSAHSLVPPPTHTLKCYSEKGKARWFWGLAVRKGPSFTSRLLLNSSLDWQGYRIRAIWELFGSLGPVPNEQVLTRKGLPVHRRCRHGALQLPGCYLDGAPFSPRLPPAPGNHAQLYTPSHILLPLATNPIKIHQPNNLKCWLFCRCGGFTTLCPTLKNPLQHSQISFASQNVSIPPWRCAFSLQMTHYINHFFSPFFFWLCSM